jgi:zona occludens toxin
MPIKFNHGAPGHFKTASAVWEDVIKALKDGRIVVTNIRGIKSVGEIEDTLCETFPDTAEIIYIDTSTPENKKIMGCWFHWVPFGAYILLDEAQFIYSKRLRVKPEEFTLYNDEPIKPENYNIDQSLDRPEHITTAFEMHRHYNWDFTLTAPNINMVPDWLLECVEKCYLHISKENVLPIPYFKRRVQVRQHRPSVSGTSVRYCDNIESKKVPVKVHDLYESTKTGKTNANNASKSPVKLWQVAIFGVIFLFVVSNIVSSAVGFFSNSGFGMANKSSTENNEMDSKKYNIQNNLVSSNTESGGVIYKNDDNSDSGINYPLPFKAEKIEIIGSLAWNKTGQEQYNYVFQLITKEDDIINLSEKDLLELGYKIYPKSLKKCVIKSKQSKDTLIVYNVPRVKSGSDIDLYKPGYNPVNNIANVNPVTQSHSPKVTLTDYSYRDRFSITKTNTSE